MSAVKTMLAGGVLFLLPFGLLVFLLGELIDIAMLVSSPITSLFPADDMLGKTMAIVVAWFLLLLVCYLAGLLARFAVLSKASGKITELLVKLIPGYRMLQGRISEFLADDAPTPDKAVPVLVSVGSVQRFGYELARDDAVQMVTVFLPNSPDPTTGIIVRAGVADVLPVALTTGQLFNALEFYGKGLEAIGSAEAKTPKSQDGAVERSV